MADGQSTLEGVLRSEDTEVMIRSLTELGIRIDVDWDRRRLTIEGCKGRLPSQLAELEVAGSGTTLRFLTALVATGNGQFTLDGNEQMRKRPIGNLIDALAACGVDATSAAGYPPVTVRAAGLQGGSIAVRGDLSSQYLSGLLLAAPAARGNVDLEIVGPLVSKPYVEMTIQIMRSFGVEVETYGEHHFRITAPQSYQPRQTTMEPDASAASYFWAAAAITGGRVRVEGLCRESLQGDVAFCECLEQMGCDLEYGAAAITVHGRPLRGIDVDMNAISDTVQTLAVVALFAEGATTIRGVGHIRHKETDRLGDLATELCKLGARAVEREDGLQIVPGPLQGGEVATYDDHRMAMSLALVGLRVPGITILDPGCTGKTYPDYFADLTRLTLGVDGPKSPGGSPL